MTSRSTRRNPLLIPVILLLILILAAAVLVYALSAHWKGEAAALTADNAALTAQLAETQTALTAANQQSEALAAQLEAAQAAGAELEGKLAAADSKAGDLEIRLSLATELVNQKTEEIEALPLSSAVRNSMTFSLSVMAI